MKLSIEEQKKFLFDRLKTEPLRKTKENKEDEDENEVAKEEIHTLVNYYIQELKFRYVSKYKILKPHYERRWYTLIQEVESLHSNRESVWQSHITEELR